MRGDARRSVLRRHCRSGTCSAAELRVCRLTARAAAETAAEAAEVRLVDQLAELRQVRKN